MPRVAVYDSGVGGLSIFEELQTVCDDCEFVFISDNKAYPYGVKSQDQLLSRVVEVADAICHQYRPDVLIIACNTASTVCLPTLRARLDVHVVGVVPAIKPAAKLSKSRVIGLLATPGTIDRDYTQQLIDDFATDCSIVKVGSSELVDMAESFLSGGEIKPDDLEPILRDFIERTELDVLVLACTHFPLLRDRIKQVFAERSRAVTLVDSGAAIAQRVSSLLNGLDNKPIENSNACDVRYLAVFTATLQSQTLVSDLKKRGFSRIELLNL